MNTSIPISEKLACSIDEACKTGTIGRTKMNELLRSGAIQSIKVGRRRLVVVESLRAFLQPRTA